MSSSVNNLIRVIQERSYSIDSNKTEFESLFEEALHQATIDIQYSDYDSDDFAALVIINLMILGAEKGFTAAEMRDFIEKL